mgnify:CR=1 FL=1
MRCRCCAAEATTAIRSGFEFHPECDECAAYWSPDRRYPLSEVDDDYEYEEGTDTPD